VGYSRGELVTPILQTTREVSSRFLPGGVEACVISNILSIIGVPERQHLPGSQKDFAQVVYETFMTGELDAQKESLEDLYRC
jgi:hypothetical protein